MKTRHEPDTGLKPLLKKAAITATVAVAAVSVTAPAAHAMKMHHDCCVWTAPTR